MPFSEEEQEIIRFALDSIPVTLKKENEDQAKQEYEQYKLNKNFKKVEELNPLTVYYIISNLKGNEQVEFIREHIDFIRKNDEGIFLYNMMSPHSLSYSLSYDSLKEIHKLDKIIFKKTITACVENLTESLSNEEILAFFKEFQQEIKAGMGEYQFVNFYLYARQKIFYNFRNEREYSLASYEQASKLATKECSKLTDVVLELYTEKISTLSDSAFLRFFNHALDVDEKSVSFGKFLTKNRKKLEDIYSSIDANRLFDDFEDMQAVCKKRVFDYFGDVIFSRGDIKKYFIVINGDILCEWYKRNKEYFKDVGVEDWVKLYPFNDKLKEVLDDYEEYDLDAILKSKYWFNKEAFSYLDGKGRNTLVDCNFIPLESIDSVYSFAYLKNLEVLKRMLRDKKITKRSDAYKDNFKFFVKFLLDNKHIEEFNRENVEELERYFFLLVKGLSIVDVKSLDSFNKIVLFNRVGANYGIDESEFSYKQIQSFNVKEHKMLVDMCEAGDDTSTVKAYKTLTLKLMLVVGYERAKYILSLDNSLTTLEHLVGNVDVKKVSMDENGDPILNRKIINLLFRDLKRNRVELMIKDKTNELYKYFPRIFNEWDLIEINKKNKDLKTIIEYLKSDEVSLSAKHYRLKGLFKFIGCSKEIVSDTFKLHDEMLLREGSTIPSVCGKIGDYEYEVLRLDDMEGLVVGNKTDCCFAVKGISYSSLQHALTNKNGRILVVKKDGELVAHSWLWRNGNVLCLDNIEVAKSIKSVDFLDVYIQFADRILEKSRATEPLDSCLKNVTVGRNSFDKNVEGLEKYKRYIVQDPSNLVKPDSTSIIVDKLPSIEEKGVYSDAKKVQVLLKGKGDFSCYDNECYYFDERKPILGYTKENTDSAEYVLLRVNALRCIKAERENTLDGFELNDIGDYVEIWCNDDWYIAIDKNGNEEKYALSFNDDIKQEMVNVLNNKIKKVVKK